MPPKTNEEWVWIKEDRWHQTWLHKEHGERQINTELLNFILQKARHDWLQEEIVKLEVIKNEIPKIIREPFELAESVGKKMLLDKIIQRYQSELDQLIPVEIPVKGTQLDCKEHGVNQIVIKDGVGWCPECLSAEVLSK